LYLNMKLEMRNASCIYGRTAGRPARWKHQQQCSAAWSEYATM